MISIWIVTGSLFSDIDLPHLWFEIKERNSGVLFSKHFNLHVLQLDKWVKPKALQREDLWLYSLKEGKHWKSLPPELQNIKVFEVFMSTLNVFSDRETKYHLYRRQEEYRRIELSDKAEKAALEEKLIAAAEAAETEKARADAAEAENRRLKELLKNQSS